MWKLSEKDLAKLLREHPDISTDADLTVLDENAHDNKLGAVREVVDGFRFDSGLEAKRYARLRMWERTGVIESLDCDHKLVCGRTKEAITRHRWILQPKFKDQRAITYTDDFQYVIPGIGLIVEDSKGWPTAEFKRSRKMFAFHYPEINFFENYKINGFYTD